MRVPAARCRRAIPVVDEPFERVVEALRPQVVLDARMRKRENPEFQRGVAPLTIGLGPNFVAGENVDLVVETAWGEQMGEIILPDSCEAWCKMGSRRPPARRSSKWTLARTLPVSKGWANAPSASLTECAEQSRSGFRG